MKDQQKQHLIDMMKSDEELGLYDKPNETLEEAAERILDTNKVADEDMILSDTFSKVVNSMVEIAKWQQERMYSEEEVEIIIQKLMMDVHCGDLCYGDNVIDFKLSPRQWFEQFKKK